MDRQDIDALLIGALYGELTPADEARLATHLESHPTDRGALDDLKSARLAVRESRIFEVQLDPPQALSALLLQEAHRRAPKRVVETEEKESWFYRFARSFMAHPAMAAAAMLVLVVGVAGTLYMKKGSDQFADKQVSAPAAEYREDNAQAVATPTVEGAAAGSAALGNAGSAFNADLYEGDKADSDQVTDRGALADGKAAKNELSKDSASTRWKQQESQVAEPKKKANKGIRVETEEAAPKELEGRAGTKLDFSGSDDSFARPPGNAPMAGAQAGPAPAADAPANNIKGGWSGGGGAGAGAPATGSTTTATVPRAPAPSRGMTAQPSPPPPPPAATPAPAKKPATVAKPSATTTTGTVKPTETATDTKKSAVRSDPKPEPAPAQEAKKDESSLMAWAKAQHNSAIALVKKGDCAAAARVALGVSNRAADYYAQNMATDRALKQCMQYINDARDRDAERSGKARAQKRVNADEAAPAAPAESVK